MVNLKTPDLDRVFSALSDPTRRAMIAQLGDHDGLSVSELGEPFDMTLPAILKHLTVLEAAGLVTRAKSGRTVTCRLTAEPMEAAVAWLNRYEAFWSGQLDRLTAFVEKDGGAEPR